MPCLCPPQSAADLLTVIRRASQVSSRHSSTLGSPESSDRHQDAQQALTVDTLVLGYAQSALIKAFPHAQSAFVAYHLAIASVASFARVTCVIPQSQTLVHQQVCATRPQADQGSASVRKSWPLSMTKTAQRGLLATRISARSYGL